jgi:flagellar motor protein MotB
MKRTGGDDHFSNSLTDLMTSLMVIFVLLLVTKLNNQAGRKESAVRYILDKLNAHAQQFKDGEKLYREGDVIVIVIPDQLMSFKQASAERGGADLSVEGRKYLGRHVPGWAEILCSPTTRQDVDTIVVEGHSDTKPFGAADDKINKEKNLELSQQRSMAVVAESLSVLGQAPKERGCFLDLLSATGRGDAHPINSSDPYSPQNRRVEFRIRVRPGPASSLADVTGGTVRN